MAYLRGGQSDFFGLDIGTIGLRVVQLHGTGQPKSLAHYGEAAFDPTVASGGSIIDKHRFSQILAQLVKKAGISTKNVAVNIPSQRVFTTIVDIPKMDPAELEKTIRYQADSFIPMPVAKSKIDWQLIGDSPTGSDKLEVLLSGVANDFVEARLELVEAGGFNVIAMEADNMALARSVVAPESLSPQLILDIGSITSDLVIVKDSVPHLVRSIPIGSQNIVHSASQLLGADIVQAQQFVYKFGLSRDKLEGKVYNAIIGVIDSLVVEIEKSIKFFAGRYAGAKLDRIIVTGGASTLPELPLYIANKFAINVEIGNAWRNVSVPDDAQNEVLAVSSHFAVAVGLAERNL
ncbi:MAG: type IV pilus assembly protein PilM [Patescibacteria group bacterium]